MTLLKIVRAVRDRALGPDSSRAGCSTISTDGSVRLRSGTDIRVHVWENRIFADGSQEFGVTVDLLQGQSVETRLMGDRLRRTAF